MTVLKAVLRKFLKGIHKVTRLLIMLWQDVLFVLNV